MKIKASLLMVACAVLLSGCGSWFGNTEYGCPGMPQGVRCMSARQVYEATEDRDSLEATNLDGTPVDGGGAPVDPATAGQPLPTVGHAPLAPAPDMSDGRVPIRSPAQVLRIFFAPWEDDQGNLHFSGMVFSEVQPRRWEIGLPAEKESAVMKPLQTGLVTTSRPEEPERAPQAAAPNKGKHTSGPAAKQEQQ